MSEQLNNQQTTDGTSTHESQPCVETHEVEPVNNETGTHTPHNSPNQTNQRPMVYSVSLDNVKYDSVYRINKGAIAQLVMSLKDMKERLAEPDKNNKVQTKLYPEIKNICNKLCDKYVELLSNVSDDNLREFSYFLMGPYGDGTLRYPTTNRSENKKYRYSELGPTFRAMTNRLAHASREVHSRLESDKYAERRDSYVNLKMFLTTFNEELKECSLQWKTTVYSVRNEEGIENPADRDEKNNVNTYKQKSTQFVQFKKSSFNDSTEK